MTTNNGGQVANQEEKTPCYLLQLPDHVLAQILCKLPTKTLVQCQLVCKSWRRYPNLCRDMLSRTPPCLLILNWRSWIGGYCQLLTLVDLKSNFRVRTIIDENKGLVRNRIPQDAVMKFPIDENLIYNLAALPVGSCNGFLFIHTQVHWCPQLDGIHIHIFNPLTSESISFIRLLILIKKKALIMKKILILLGFVVLDTVRPVSNAYKAVGFIPVMDGPGKVAVKVLTLSSCIWRSIGNSVYSLGYGSSSLGYGLSSSYGVYLNGFLHWIDDSIEGSRIICAFDVERECFKELLLPPSCSSSNVINLDLVLGVLKGSLSVTFRCASKLIVWVMKHHGCNDQSWTKELEISGADLSIKQVMEHTDEGKVFLLNEYCRSKLEVYTPGRTGLEVLEVDGVPEVRGVPCTYRTMVETFPYIPSFVSIRDIFGCESSNSSS